MPDYQKIIKLDKEGAFAKKLEINIYAYIIKVVIKIQSMQNIVI